MLRQQGIYKAMLPLKRLKRAAAWLAVVVERGIDNLREQLSRCSQAGSRPPIDSVKRLAQNKLATRLAIADVDCVMSCAVTCSLTVDYGSCGARINATNDDIG